MTKKVRINEGSTKKGNISNKPTGQRPPAPKPQPKPASK